ncbi:PREDICTED: uncharacterized protein LOC105954152 [Erythranthe guttata]|uniref:uncharacterized protein LOC105954152 n=1 Tax=Erythranthe guttata TaxID=4155 RepID=UPI00064D80B0|nr:PREDICTED: uncharacterized protein LOC105954152 [Erythranthe guttata]|eukprot:XP_012833284.1 PREDICTED: uncharacterized protein LOC105954152 [Erythranthe guttata]
MNIGMEESDQNNRVRWNNSEVDKCFLDACIQEVALNGREGDSLKSESWTKIMNTLKKNHNFVVCQRQMKNRYDYLKQKYQAWLPLTMKTGNIYNHATNTINMTKEEWTEYIKAHPKAKSLRLAPYLILTFVEPYSTVPLLQVFILGDLVPKIKILVLPHFLRVMSGMWNKVT